MWLKLNSHCWPWWRIGRSKAATWHGWAKRDLVHHLHCLHYHRVLGPADKGKQREHAKAMRVMSPFVRQILLQMPQCHNSNPLQGKLQLKIHVLELCRNKDGWALFCVVIKHYYIIHTRRKELKTGEWSPTLTLPWTTYFWLNFLLHVRYGSPCMDLSKSIIV